MSAPAPLAPELAAELDSIDRAREAAFAALREHNRAGLTAEGARAMLDAMGDIDRRLAAVHRATWPRHRGCLFVTHGAAYLESALGRRVREVWRRA